MQTFKRTVYCGQIDEKLLDKKITLSGWVSKRRDHGNLIFIDLRDRTGIMQLVINPQIAPNATELAKNIRAEFVLSVQGNVVKRSPEAINEKIKTGKYELLVNDLKILNKSKTLPYQLEEADNVDDELRLKYRYLDLRREKMQNFLKLRNDVTFAIRQHLNEQNFYEIETPILSKSTPEGARDFLVPSRLQSGKFYALPQSPQIYKQLLMASGFDKYFQIARCFRDEDFRSNRQPEFSQLDIEMSFIQEEDVINVCENIVKFIWKKIFNTTLKLPFKQYSYQEVFDKFGTDKPDLRFSNEIKDYTTIFKSTELKFLKSIIEGGGKVGGILIKDHQFTRSELDKLVEWSKSEIGSKGLLYIKFENDQTPISTIAKFLPTNFFSEAKKIFSELTTTDTIFLVADEYKSAWEVLGKLRVELAKKLNLIKTDEFNFAWVTNFPLLEYDKDEKKWFAMHHPFTSPQNGWGKLQTKDIKARAYDLVCNGEELGGGSIRIHNKDIQEKIFELLGIDKKEAKEKFGFLLEAQELGFPPHGGFALGLDRLIMLITKTDSIRDVIAFPKMQSGICPMMQTPSEVNEKQLKELNIKI